MQVYGFTDQLFFQVQEGLSDYTLLLTGQAGTGKSVISLSLARSLIHYTMLLVLPDTRQLNTRNKKVIYVGAD